MRKVVVVSISTAISLGAWSVALANAPVNPKQTHRKSYSKSTAAFVPYPSLHSGFFSGFRGAYIWTKGKLTQDTQATALGPLKSSQRTDLGIDGGEVGLFLGYDHYFPSNWAVGIEGGAQWAALSGEINTLSSAPALNLASNMKTRLKLDWSFDVALRLGYKVYEHSLWYVKVGAQFTHFKINIQNLQTNKQINITNTAAPLAGKSKYYTGLLTGLGAEIPLTSCFSLGAEYNFTWYQRIPISKVSNNGNGDFIKVRIYPYENQVVARLIWKL